MSHLRCQRCLFCMDNNTVTVVGGGLGGLITAISAAEAGAPVHLNEQHSRLGGRARSGVGPYVPNDGPHVLYADGAFWPWLVERHLAAPYRRLPLRPASQIRFRLDGRRRALPPVGLLALFSHRRRSAPIDQDFRSWLKATSGEGIADIASAFMGVVTYTSDSGDLSAKFVWDRLLRVGNPTGGPRYLVGGWQALVDRLVQHARGLGVVIDTETPVIELPGGPTVIATSLASARRLLARPLPTPAISGSTVLLDVAIKPRRGDAFIVSDLDQPGWAEAFSRVDKTLSADGTVLIQAQRPAQPGETQPQAAAAIATLVDSGWPGWQERASWQRSGVANHRTGALDMPGYDWHDRPAVDQGDGIFLAGDETAAPGLLSEVSFHSAVIAATAAATYLNQKDRKLGRIYPNSPRGEALTGS